MKIEQTFTGRIYVGFFDRHTNTMHSIVEVREWLQNYCDSIGFCVTLEPTEFIYTNGNEPGCVIGLIQYPRFPMAIEQIKERATFIADSLLKMFNQGKVSIVFTDETIMLEESDK